MKFTWKGKWRKGEIVIEAETLQELNTALKELASSGEMGQMLRENSNGFPEIPPVSGCADAIRVLMENEWGMQRRSMNDIREALEANALYFSKGTLSGTLTTLAKRGDLKRLKEAGRWVYFAR